MGRIAEVKHTERVQDEDGLGLDVPCDAGDGDAITAPHFGPAGDDSPPLAGDYVALEDSGGSGGEQAVGYADTRNAGKARAGEWRRYGRTPAGAPISELWAKGDGTVLLVNEGGGSFEMAADGKVTINGVVIDTDGNISAPGNIAAEGDVSGAEVSNSSISLGTHVHTSAAPGSPTGAGTSPPPPPGP